MSILKAVSMKRYEDDMRELNMNIAALKLDLIRAQSAIRKLQSAVDIPERVDKYAENIYRFRGPVRIESTPDGTTVILLEEEGE